MHSNGPFLSLFLASSVVCLAAAQGPPSQEDVVDCEVRTVIVDHEDQPHSATYKCITHPDEEPDGSEDMVYDLPDWVTTKFRSALESQSTNYIRIQGAHLLRIPLNNLRSENLRSVPSTITILPESQLVADENKSVVEFSAGPFTAHRAGSTHDRRQLMPSASGINKVLMVRVSTNDGAVSLSADAMAERAFGSVATLKSTYEECSFGKMKIQQASGTGIHNGVAEVFLSTNIQSTSVYSLENMMANALSNKVGGNLDRFDHIAYCVPDGSYAAGDSNWLAYAYVGGHRSVYNNENCGHLSKLVHEVAHNLGLGHAGKDETSEYADMSGAMGYSAVSSTFPVQCFNPAKNWQLGWYSGKRTTVNVNSNPWSGRLYGYVDYDQGVGTVLINIGDIYLQYNKISSINRDTRQKRNQIAVVRQSSTRDNSHSSALAGLDTSTPSYQVRNFDGNRNLVIEVCDHVESVNGLSYYELSIRLDNQASQCGDVGSPPTLSTVAAPTPNPTNQAPAPPPTEYPTMMMMVAPNPTSSPTPMPTPIPTPYPTRQPTAPPSMPPTPNPTVASTPHPTSAPTIAPTVHPTPLASTAPTRSNSPSGLPSSRLTCDDNPRAKFPTNAQHGNQRCVWLAARPMYQEQFCISSHPAYKICEETCGACTDDCEDTEGTFLHHGINRPCLWLSLRLNVQNVVCVSGHEAMDVCPETCGACDGATA